MSRGEKLADVTAFVLTGGRSSRMGTDKALLPFRGRTLLQHALQAAGEAAARTVIVGSREKYRSFAEVVEDVFPGQGPLAGIHAALGASRTELNLVLAVDTPLTTAAFLRYLSCRAADSGAVVTVARTSEGGLHPLCGAYRKQFAAVAEAALRQRRNKIDALFAAIATDVIGPEDLAREGFDESIFRNLNTPEDVQAVEAIPAAGGGARQP